MILSGFSKTRSAASSESLCQVFCHQSYVVFHIDLWINVILCTLKSEVVLEAQRNSSMDMYLSAFIDCCNVIVLTCVLYVVGEQQCPRGRPEGRGGLRIWRRKLLSLCLSSLNTSRHFCQTYLDHSKAQSSWDVGTQFVLANPWYKIVLCSAWAFCVLEQSITICLRVRLTISLWSFPKLTVTCCRGSTGHHLLYSVNGTCTTVYISLSLNWCGLLLDTQILGFAGGYSRQDTWRARLGDCERRWGRRWRWWWGWQRPATSQPHRR